jgi:hypothetical protein
MTTGPENYRIAEAHLGDAQRAADPELERYFLAAAQVHATLALAAATAMGSRSAAPGMNELDFEAWDRVAGVKFEVESRVSA